jgi:SLA1 homology domain 1, SHD1
MYLTPSARWNVRRYAFLLMLVVMLAWPDALFARTWRLKNGTTEDGVFSGVVNGIVELDDGGIIRKIPLKDLVDEDQAYVKEQLKKLDAALSNESDSDSSDADASSRNESRASSSSGGSTRSGSSGIAAPPPPTNKQGIVIDVRTWIDSKGRSIEATYAGVDGPNIQLEQANGSIINVLRDNLSDADKEYLDSLLNYVARFADHEWTDVGGNKFRGQFVQLNVFSIRFLEMGTIKKIDIFTNDLSEPDIQFLCEMLDQRYPNKNNQRSAAKYREWQYTNTKTVLGRFHDANDSQLVIQQETSLVSIPFSQLNNEDRAEIRKHRPDLLKDTVMQDDASAITKTKSKDDGSFRIPSIPVLIWTVIVVVLVGLIVMKYVGESMSLPED